MPEKKTNFQKFKDNFSFSNFVRYCRTDCLNCPLFEDCSFQTMSDRVNCVEALAFWALTECED